MTEPLPEAFNEALKNDLSRGQNAINIRLDKAAMAGCDPDAETTPAKAVGAGGLSLATTADFATVLGGIDNLLTYPIQIETGTSALAVTALLASYLNAEGKTPH